MSKVELERCWNDSQENLKGEREARERGGVENQEVLREKTVIYLVVLQGPRVQGPAQKKLSYHTA